MGAYKNIDMRQDKTFLIHLHHMQLPPPSLSNMAEIIMVIMMNIISTIESPEPKFQLEFCVNSCSITLPIKKILLPPSKSEITKVVSAGTNTMVIPDYNARYG